MKREPGDATRLKRFLAPHGDEFVAAVHGRTATAVGDVHVVNVEAGILEQRQRAGHDDFDVVGMRGDGEDGRHGERRKLRVTMQNGDA